MRTMSSYNRLVKDFFQKINPSNPLHYYGYKHIVRDKDSRSEEGDEYRQGNERRKRIKKHRVICGHENETVMI